MAKRIESTRTRRTGSRTSRKSNGGNSWFLAALIVLAAAVSFGAYWLFKGPSGPPPGPDILPGDDDKPTITEKDVDYRKPTRNLQDQIESAFKKTGGTVKQTGDEVKEAPRGNGGKIHWTFRSWDVQLPEGKSAESIAGDFSKQWSKEGKIAVTVNPTGPNSQRVAVFMLDTLGGDPLRLQIGEVRIQGGKKDPKDKPAKTGRLAIVIDDFGYRGDLIASFASYPYPLTFAILPNHPHTGEAARAARSVGKEYILHLPMEALGNASEESVTIHVGDSQERINEMINTSLAQIPGASGVNNHQGSKVTSDGATIRRVMKGIAPHGIFFLDSRTSGNSQGEQAAREMGLASGSNQLFLDGQADVEYIRQKIREGAEAAKRNGTFIVIGHDRPATLKALQQSQDVFDEVGVELVPLSSLIY